MTNKKLIKNTDTINITDTPNFTNTVERENCLISIDKNYNLTVATNMLLTLIATLIMVHGLNYFNIFDHKYNISELFLTLIIIFIIWNFIIGYTTNIEKYSISTNTSLLLAVFLLPLLHVGPSEFISYFC